MSAYLTSQDTIAALSSYWFISCLDRSMEQPEQCLQRVLFRAMKSADKDNTDSDILWSDAEAVLRCEQHLPLDEFVFIVLLKANVESLKACYSDSPSMWENAKDYKFKKSYFGRMAATEFKNLGFISSMCSGYSYQSCEHDDWETSFAYHIIKDIKSKILNAVEKNEFSKLKTVDEQVNVVPWASFTEPAIGALV